MKTITGDEYRNLSEQERKNFTGIVKYIGTIIFFKNNKYHREDGPSYITKSGHQAWFFEGKPHNLNGPARIYPDGTEEYWIHGVHIKNCTSVEALQLYIDMLKLKNIGANN